MTEGNYIKRKARNIADGLKKVVSGAGQKTGYSKWPYEKKTAAGIVVLILLFVMPFFVRGCSGDRTAPPRPRAVETALAVKKDVPAYLDSFGQMLSTGDVDIRSQVTGKILEVYFVQGQEVEGGDLLMLIDTAPYQAQLDKAKALFDQNTAIMRLKSDTLERNRVLYEKQLISKQEIEEYQSDLDAATATVALDKAGVEAALIDLEYCGIKAPFKGVAGKRLVDPGNIVSANSGTVLVNVKSVDDLYVDFTLAEKHLSKVRTAMETRQLEVQVFVPGEEGLSVTGNLDLVDNSVDNRTGTFALRASVDNGKRVLWPGQFVTVRLILGQKEDAIIVPFSAAKIGQQGYFVFVVDVNGKADLRHVAIGSRQGEDIVIEKGVEAGETVVTSGQMALRPGTPVSDVSKQVRGDKIKRN